MTSPASTPGSPKTSTERPRSKSHTASGHKKSPSANFFSKIPFLRPTPDASPLTSPTSDDVVPFPDVPDAEEDFASPRNSSLADVLDAQGKSRKRKGSLRKTALLGTGRLRLDRRFSSGDSTKGKSPTKRKTSGLQIQQDAPTLTSAARASVDEDNVDSPTKRSLEEEGQGVQSLRIETAQPDSNPLLSPLTSPTGPYALTTDEEDRFTLPSTVGSLSLPTSKPSPSPSPPSSESSLTNPSSPAALRAPHKPATTSPLAIPAPPEVVEEWDYSATEWWGWIILLVTWIVFVVGMGSCLEVWSWAWDVGETPYAPPELEDDPTLPIVGYYPALMVLTAVMSWVWVVIAWMGMKYFKHAKIQGDDT